MRVAITGASGLIGSALSVALSRRGDEVVKLVRREPSGPGQVRWAPDKGELNSTELQGVSAVVNLAGAGIADKRWTAAYKRTLLDSRVDSTRTVVRAITELDEPVRLVNGSAMGYYGDRGDEVLDEDAAAGAGFLAEVVTAWEAAAAEAVHQGLPVAYARTGLVLSSAGGAMGRVLPLARLGLAGPLGNGRQWWSWITLRDEVAALIHLIDHPEVTGPVNLGGPEPVRQRDAMKALGVVLHRPALLPAPTPALRLVLGEMSADILASARMSPKALQESGFEWTDRTVADGMRYAAGV
ncbi:TIGR01777 family oxidoreductase [Rudaeicoccus suwonensis]|uniref:TIGR01777 family protein n=1 Tax=Rudaeicoccus suwonensis TaxID=657409 RepID=A0A561EBS5_9MICO|nr:TIGR01777 family oxidoreductase [Rudaeicoccus suwonensis]TWE13052.1 hypothetical protein BKA23_1880 [Rudaeicoccus suwonensis]